MGRFCKQWRQYEILSDLPELPLLLFCELRDRMLNEPVCCTDVHCHAPVLRCSVVITDSCSNASRVLLQPFLHNRAEDQVVIITNSSSRAIVAIIIIITISIGIIVSSLYIIIGIINSSIIIILVIIG